MEVIGRIPDPTPAITTSQSEIHFEDIAFVAKASE